MRILSLCQIPIVGKGNKLNRNAFSSGTEQALAQGEASGMAVALDRRQDGRWTDADNRSDSSFLAQPAIARAALNGKLTNLNQLTAGPALERLQSEKSATQHSYETS